jgi:hypothetical protein
VLRDSKAGLAAPQALAKLVITTPPQLLFPPPHQTNALNALAPLYQLLVSREASLLQQFEALMALTNLASIDGQFGARIIDAKIPLPKDEFKGRGRGDTKVIDKVEELMLDDNNLVRRAATELVCNLVNSEAGFLHFSGEDAPAPKEEGKRTVRATARLGVLLLLTDVDDLPTRLAASGALAVLTESPSACAALAAGGAISGSQRSVWDRLGDLFEPGGERPDVEDAEGAVRAVQTVSSAPPDVSLAHRGAVVVANLLEYVKELAPAKEKAARKAIAESRLEDRLTGAARALANSRDGEGMQVAMMLAQTKKLFA